MIKFENILKTYGRTVALRDVNLELAGGKVVGILGPNGSGKTTLLKLIQGYLKPTQGRVTVFGNEIGPETKSRVSYLPDRPFVPKDYTIEEAKELYETFFEDFDGPKFERLLSQLDLNVESTIAGLSKGMSEKFHLALILSRDADIYVIDEPIAGVDLVAREQILNAIFSNIEKDKLLVLTTHLIDELESLLDEVVYIANGEVILQGDAEELRLQRGKSLAGIYRELFGYVG